MSEANQNSNSFDAQSDFELVKTIELTVHEVVDDEVFSYGDRSSNLKEAKTLNELETCNLKQNIDWHKTALKLREHNRKLLKQVFQLEQEKAELEDKLHIQLEKSYSSDSAIAQQAEQIENGLEQIAFLSEQLEIAEHEVKAERDSLEHFAKQLELSQKQTARLERECALLQESHNEKASQLINKDKQIQELLARSSKQYARLQSTPALDKYANTKGALERKPLNNEITRIKSQPIQVWSVAITEDKIPLPAAPSRLLNPEKATDKTSTWPAPAIAKSQQTKKIKSLAAVELPKFPRQG